MANLKYSDKHNMVAFLKKPNESDDFYEIVNFLKRTPLRYALTHNPTIYDSLVKQFWQTATVRTIANGNQELLATINSKAYTITEAFVRSSLLLADATGITNLPDAEIHEGLSTMGFLIGNHVPLLPAMLAPAQGEGSAILAGSQPTPTVSIPSTSQTPIPPLTEPSISSPSRITDRQAPEIPQSQGPTQTPVADKATTTSVEVDAEGTATTTASLDACCWIVCSSRAIAKAYGKAAKRKMKGLGSTVCDKKSDASKENSDESLVKGQVSEDTSSSIESSLNVDKETVFLDKKIEFVKPKNHEKPVKKSVRPVNTAHPKPAVHSAKSMSHFSKQAQLTAQRPFYKQTTLTSRYVNTAMRHYHTERFRAGNTARSYTESVNAIRTKRGKPLMDDKGFVDSGCSRHMTGNIAYLSDFKEFDGGYVTFGGGAHGGRISGKGTLKTDSLDFEDVYFVNELKFNLFSVSQMCDKKNYVLFTDTECLVLSPNFKLPDEKSVQDRNPNLLELEKKAKSWLTRSCKKKEPRGTTSKPKQKQHQRGWHTMSPKKEAQAVWKQRVCPNDPPMSPPARPGHMEKSVPLGRVKEAFPVGKRRHYQEGPRGYKTEVSPEKKPREGPKEGGRNTKKQVRILKVRETRRTVVKT
ncbi:hypothetical protein Tco_0313144 [Tanacetum coccineum]